MGVVWGFVGRVVGGVVGKVVLGVVGRVVWEVVGDMDNSVMRAGVGVGDNLSWTISVDVVAGPCRWRVLNSPVQVCVRDIVIGHCCGCGCGSLSWLDANKFFLPPQDGPARR